MKYFFAAILFAYFVAALSNTSVKPTKSNENKAHCNVNNNYNSFYAGPNCKKIEQRLAEIESEIRALRRNDTSGSSRKSVTEQQLAEIRNEIRALRRNKTGGSGQKSVERQLAEIKTEIRALRKNDALGCAKKVYKNCAEVYKSGDKISEVYKINPDGLGEFDVFCDQKTARGGWTVFQKRVNGSVNFYRGWNDYKRGFGNLNGEFWLGLDKIHRLTVSGRYKLRVELEDSDGKTAFAEYSSFAVTSERTNYKLSVGSYSGTAGDSLGWHRGMSFTTKDRDNDQRNHGNCALAHKGGWWYKYCHHSNLNGLYLPGKINHQGMCWYHWKNNFYSVKRSEMKIRPKNF